MRGNLVKSLKLISCSVLFIWFFVGICYTLFLITEERIDCFANEGLKGLLYECDNLSHTPLEQSIKYTHKVMLGLLWPYELYIYMENENGK